VYAPGGIAGTGIYTFERGVTAAGTYSGGSNVLVVKYSK